MPAAHPEQDAEDGAPVAALNVPALQLTQLVDAAVPVAARNVPAAQGVHATEPVATEYAPMIQ